MLKIRLACLVTILLFTTIISEETSTAYRPENTIIAFDIHGVIANTSKTGVCKKAVRFQRKRAAFFGIFKPRFLKNMISSLWQHATFHNVLQVCDQYNPALSELLIDLSAEQVINQDVADIIKNLKAAGYTLHIVSNIEQRSLQILKRKFPDVFNAFDAEYIPHNYDARAKIIRKPNPEFFNDYFAQCVPAGYNVIFIDDSARNIASFKSCSGMQAHKFVNAEKLQSELTNHSILTEN